MEYSQEQYQEDLKLVCYTYYKYFKYLKTYKEDLIQNGLVCVLENKAKYDNNLCTYAGFVCTYARYGMLHYLRELKRFNNNGSFLSIDAEINGTDGVYLIDILQDEKALNDLNSGFDMDFLNNSIDKAINKVCKHKYLDIKDMKGSTLASNLYNINKRKNKFNDRRKQIILECLKNSNKAEVARKFGVTRECVRNYFERFKEALKIELKETGYLC